MHTKILKFVLNILESALKTQFNTMCSLLVIYHFYFFSRHCFYIFKYFWQPKKQCFRKILLRTLKLTFCCKLKQILVSFAFHIFIMIFSLSKYSIIFSLHICGFHSLPIYQLNMFCLELLQLKFVAFIVTSGPSFYYKNPSIHLAFSYPC